MALGSGIHRPGPRWRLRFQRRSNMVIQRTGDSLRTVLSRPWCTCTTLGSRDSELVRRRGYRKVVGDRASRIIVVVVVVIPTFPLRVPQGARNNSGCFFIIVYRARQDPHPRRCGVSRAHGRIIEKSQIVCFCQTRTSGESLPWLYPQHTGGEKID